MVRRLAGCLVALAGVAGLGACSDGEPTTADPTVPTRASSTTTTGAAAPDVSVVPATIDEPYLDAVLAAIDEVDGEATQRIKATKQLAGEPTELLQSIYSKEAFAGEAEVWLISLTRDPEVSGIRPNPGRRITAVDRIITASPACVWLAVRRDHSQTDVDPGPVRVSYLALRPLDRANDPQGRNRTAWMIDKDVRLSDGSEPPDPCA